MRTLALTLLLAFAAASFGHSAAVSAPGQARVELTIPGSVFIVGQVIPYELKLTNVSSDLLCYQTSGNPRAAGGYLIRMADAGGKALSTTPLIRPYSVLFGRSYLQQRESVTFEGSVNQWFVLDEHGVYKVTASWRPCDFMGMPVPSSPKSAPVSIEIKPATQQDRDNALAQARTALQTAETVYEKADAIRLLAYTTDDRAILDIVRAGMDEALSGNAQEALLRFANKDAVREAIVNECGISGGKYRYVLDLLSREPSAR